MTKKKEEKREITIKDITIESNGENYHFIVDMFGIHLDLEQCYYEIVSVDELEEMIGIVKGLIK